MPMMSMGRSQMYLGRFCSTFVAQIVVQSCAGDECVPFLQVGLATPSHSDHCKDNADEETGPFSQVGFATPSHADHCRIQWYVDMDRYQR